MSLPLDQFAFVRASRSSWTQARPRWANQLRNINNISCNIGDLEDILPVSPRADMLDTFYDDTKDQVGKKVYKRKNLIAWLRIDKKLLDDRSNLHSDNESAFVSGAVELYFLHGVIIPDPALVLTPPEQIDSNTILKIQSADVRRELIRKKGIEQVLDGLFHRTLDVQGNYSLLEVLLSNQIWSPSKFLKMLNPSVGCWHLEGVANEVQTVEDALKWRNNNWFAQADILT